MCKAACLCVWVCAENSCLCGAGCVYMQVTLHVGGIGVACAVYVWSVCLWDAGPEAGWAGGWFVGRGVGSGVLCSDRVALLCHRTFLNLGSLLWKPSSM